MIRLHFKMLLHDRTRFIVTTIGVAFSVMLVLVQVGLFEGLIGYAADTILPVRQADLWITSKNTQNIDFASYFPDSRVYIVKSTPGVARADNLIVNFLQIHLPNGSSDGVMVYGLDNYWKWGVPWNITSGNPIEIRQGPYMFLDDFAAHRYGQFHVGEYREILNKRFKIVGTVTGIRSFTTIPIAFIDFNRAQNLTDFTIGKTAYILVHLVPGADKNKVIATLKKRLPYNDVLTSEQWARRGQYYWIFKTGLGFNMGMIVFLGCLVGVVILGQTLYTTTMEHIKEFGMIKAIGGTNSIIYKLLIKQAITIAITGYICGLLLSLMVKPLAKKGDLDLCMSPEILLVVFISTLTLCLAASTVSFRKVSRIDPALLFRG